MDNKYYVYCCDCKKFYHGAMSALELAETRATRHKRRTGHTVVYGCIA